MVVATPRPLVTAGSVLAWNRKESVLTGTVALLTVSNRVPEGVKELLMITLAGPARVSRLLRRDSVTLLA